MDTALPAGGDRDQGPKVLAISWTFSALALLLYTSRLWSKARITHNTSSDDAVTGVSLILLIVAAAFLSAAVHHGLGRHPYYLDPRTFRKATELAIFFEPPCIMAFSLPKFAVAQVLIRISPPNKRRAFFLYGLTLSQILTTVICIVLLFTSCSPVEALWTPHLAKTARCRSHLILTHFTIFHGSYSAFVDLILAAFPVLIFWNLRIEPKVKFRLCGLMGLTALSSICAIIKSTKFKSAFQGQANFTWSSVPLNNWSLIEAAVIISAVSVPQLRPLLHYVRSIKKGRTSTMGKKDATITAYRKDGQELLRPGQSHGVEREYTVSVWNTTPPPEEDPAFIKLPDKIFRATDFRLEYEASGQDLPCRSNQKLTL